MAKSKKKNRKKSKGQPEQAPPDPAQACEIYLLTPPRIDDLGSFAKTLEVVLKTAPIASLQIRLKDTPRADIIEIANTLIPIAHKHDTIVLINDDPQIALETDADGVHLGQSDMNINLAREVLNDNAIVGITCHNSKELAFRACSDGTDYVAFGAFYETSTKPGAQPADLEILTWWHEAVEIPCVAIGGINPENAKHVIEAGADFIAVSSGVWDWPGGPVAAIEQLRALCLQHSPL